MADDLRPDSVLAAELALGLLEGDELFDAQRRSRDDLDFANEVERWQRHFATWFGQVPDAELPADGYDRLLRLADPSAANDNPARPWKIATGLSGALAAGLALLLLVRQPIRTDVPPAATPSAVVAAALTAQDGVTKMPAVIDVTTHRLRMPAGLDVPTGRSAQLWVIVGEASPEPIGILAPSAEGMSATIPSTVTLPAGSVLAISIEPAGGSPTGRPTGPVVASGTLTPV
ncbi:anti-sigma factor [Sphingomonas jaspsi]|uniref:anti-sigma factor n=1 Tax=Sphingomonas jaspsi TaxID=392409 RepID=UPI00068786D1|nr:anti-sigma factor [Sphingomonas jaspsi]